MLSRRDQLQNNGAYDMIDQNQDISKLEIVEDKLTKVFRSKVMYEHILNGVTHLIIIIDDTLNLIWANKAAVEKCGDIIGKKSYKVYNSLDSECPDGIVRQVLEDEEVFELERSITFPNGTQGDFIITSSPLKDLTGNAVAVLQIFTDISERKQAEENLKKSELHFRTLIDNISEIITVLDSKGEISYQSSSIELVLGYSIEKILEKSFFDFVHPDDLPLILKVFQDIIKKPGASRTLKYRFHHKNGSWRVLESTGRTFIDDSGSISVILTSRDITERMHAEKALIKAQEESAVAKTAKQTIGCMMDPVIITDLHGKITQFNNAFTNLLGYESEMIGESPTKIIVEKDALKIQEAIKECLKTGFLNNFECTTLGKDGKKIPVLFNITVLKNSTNKSIGLIFDARDITEQKKAEQKLQLTLNDLARSNAELEQFAYIASHDLQEPLRMVASFLQLLERRYKDKIDDNANEFIAYAVDGATRMQQMINDLLKYSRVGTRGNPLEKTDSKAALDLAIANLTVAIRENNALITNDPLPIIMADSSQLIQVFQNLIENAIKFRRDVPPKIHISAERKKNEWIFSVKDNGIGIDSKHFDRIFLIFQSLHNKISYPGSGIGLSICKKIVERHGGKIWVESQHGKGSTFYFSIPVTGGKNS
ncbi:PAS domain S-box protein [Candidatus Borrarchaeum sp.]|uniref:PAS domain-containing sensor histidine kinase n=1 Tax=Candidatus Borrarchaeum sp. TaxID=2846742 RepID=UPI00257E75E7|nr:PAS domain S-box protein [Candidatus Borrarchaeum sp.]